MKKIYILLLVLFFQLSHTLVSYADITNRFDRFVTGGDIKIDGLSKIIKKTGKVFEQKVSSKKFLKFIDENNLFIDFKGSFYEYSFSKDKTFKVFNGVKETDSGIWRVKGLFSNAIQLKYNSGNELYLQFYKGFKKVSTLKNLNKKNDEQIDRELSYINKSEAETKRLDEIERIKKVEKEKKEKARLAKLKADQERKERELREKQKIEEEKKKAELEKIRIEEEKKQAEFEKIRIEEEEKKKNELQQKEKEKKELEKIKKENEKLIILSIFLIVVLYFSFKFYKNKKY